MAGFVDTESKKESESKSESVLGLEAEDDVEECPLWFLFLFFVCFALHCLFVFFPPARDDEDDDDDDDAVGDEDHSVDADGEDNFIGASDNDDDDDVVGMPPGACATATEFYAVGFTSTNCACDDYAPDCLETLACDTANGFTGTPWIMCDDACFRVVSLSRGGHSSAQRLELPPYFTRRNGQSVNRKKSVARPHRSALHVSQHARP